MRELIDISVPITPEVTTWPQMPRPTVKLVRSHAAGDDVDNSVLRMDVHTGTHLDAPRHHLPDGATAEALLPAALCGPAVVIDVGEADLVSASTLHNCAGKVPVGSRLLIRTTNGPLWDRAGFVQDYVALDPSAADWIVDRDLSLVGIDYLSIEPFGADGRTHRRLLAADVAILEGLDLRAVAPGDYLLICLPLALPGCEAAPARAVLAHASAADESGWS